MIENYKLTSYARGAGCGCKIAPNVLQEIIKTNSFQIADTKLLVGNGTNDDAAVYDIGDGNALISTTDFFMPIVNDAFDFGQIAAANAISDVYAMGGKPIMAIAILGWPIDKLPASEAAKVLEGARLTCSNAHIVLAGGHTIDSAEPFFGLSVNGMVSIKNLKTNNKAQVGDIIFITKPIGVGILSTAHKRELITDADYNILLQQLTQLNTIGLELGEIEGIHALTDVTGFGLAGHLIEMCDASNVSASLNYNKVPKLDIALPYLAQRIVPDATFRNWNTYSAAIKFESGVNVMEAFSLLPDPQTNGGLLFTTAPENLTIVQDLFKKNNIAYLEPIGVITAKTEKTITVI
jgi:selenide, water dikinase